MLLIAVRYGLSAGRCSRNIPEWATENEPSLSSKNRPFPSCFEPHYERETKCKVFITKISFHSNADKTNFFKWKALHLASLSNEVYSNSKIGVIGLTHIQTNLKKLLRIVSYLSRIDHQVILHFYWGIVLSKFVLSVRIATTLIG